MNPVEGSPPRIGATPARAASQAAPARPVGDGPASGPLGSAPEPSPAASTPPDAARRAPEGGLTALLQQARLTQAQLAGQPLPITNHHSRLILKLFGG